MRLGVLDVGSNTVHLLVVDARPGARPLPAYSHKTELRLAEHLDDDGAISVAGTAALKRLIAEALEIGEDKGCQSVLAFATSAIRDATNGDAVLRGVSASTGVDLTVLSGEQEARLTFLAVRRWFGWSSRRLLVVDIGGGSLEIASGLDEDPDAALSVPLGAGRLTRNWFSADPPDPGRGPRTPSTRPGGDRAPCRAGAAASVRPTTWWVRRRPSASWPGSVAPRRPRRARTSGGPCS